jgi:Domain of unknown function (DUF4136)
MILARSSAVALLVCMLAACGTPPIEMSGDPATIPPFKTFRVDAAEFVFATDVTPEQRDEVSKQMREAAASALKSRGYREASDADVLVGLSGATRPVLSNESGSSGGLHHVDTTVLDANRPVSSANYEIAPSGVGREGDLLMTLRDAKTGKTLWAAAANGAASTPSQGLRKARSAYAAMADKLPKAGSGPSHE